MTTTTTIELEDGTTVELTEAGRLALLDIRHASHPTAEVAPRATLERLERHELVATGAAAGFLELTPLGHQVVEQLYGDPAGSGS